METYPIMEVKSSLTTCAHSLVILNGTQDSQVSSYLCHHQKSVKPTGKRSHLLLMKSSKKDDASLILLPVSSRTRTSLNWGFK